MTLPRGTSAHVPDLNWSQVRETVLMLELAAGQIEAAMKDSNASVDVLTAAFTGMAGSLSEITATINALPEQSEVQQRLLGATDQVSGLVMQAVIAFQFYDKLAQRLAHVCHSLGGLSELVADQRRLFNPQEWVGLQEQIRAKYTTPDERTMFEAVMQGTPVVDAIEQYVNSLKSKPSDDIELF